MEANPYLYAAGAPINRVDPWGLLSNATIAASLGVDSFDEVMAIFEQEGQNWALLALLQNAKVGDSIYAGRFGHTTPVGKVTCSREYERGVSLTDPAGCSGEKSVMELVKAANEVYPADLLADYFAALRGRPTEYAWYRLNTPDRILFNGKHIAAPAYTNWTERVFLYDYIAICGGGGIGPKIGGIGWDIVGGNLCGAVDRYGTLYAGFAIETGFGLSPIPFSGSIAFGLINTSVLYSRHWTQIPSPADTADVIGGAGAGASINFIVGASSSFNWSEWPSVTNIANEVTVGVPQVSFTFLSFMRPVGSKPEWSWHWIDMTPVLSGYRRSSIRLMDDSPTDCGC